MSTRLRLVVFDCDGVLVDSEHIAARVTAECLAELGWDITPRECMALFTGMTMETARPVIEARVGPLPPAWLKNLAERSAQAHRLETTPMPGAPEMLRALDAMGLPWRVASNSRRPSMELKFAASGLAALIGDRFHSVTDGHKGKPAPDLYLAAATADGVHPAECLVVEDSLTGVLAARAAGMECLGFAPHDDGAILAEAGAHLVRELAALPPIFATAARHGVAHALGITR